MRKVFAAVLMVFGVSCMGHAADIIISSSTGINFTLTGSSLAVSVTPDIAAAPAAITALHLATNTITGLIPTDHQQLTSTSTLTHAQLESTLTAVTAATTTLKSVSDAHAATLVQVGVDTATLAGLVGSGAGDNLGNHVATTTLNMDGANITNVSTITTHAGNFIFKANGNYLNGVYFKTSLDATAFCYNAEYGGTIFEKPLDCWDSLVARNNLVCVDSTGFETTFTLYSETGRIASDGGATFTSSVTASEFYGDISNCTGFPAASPSYFTVSPSTGIDAGTLADGVKITTANITATGAGDYLKRDGTWETPTGSGDMVQATHGVAIAAATSTIAGQVVAIGASTATIRADITTLQSSTATLAATVATHTSQFSSVGTSTATLRTDVTALQQSTGTLNNQFISVGASTATLRTDVTAVQTQSSVVGASTATLRTDITALQASTGTLKSTLTSVATSTAALRTDVTAIGVSTASLRTTLAQVQTDTGTVKTQITSIGVSTASLQTQINGLSAGSGYSIYPATATASFPYGMSASTISITGTLTVSTMTVSSMTITNLAVTSWIGDYQGVKVGTATIALGIFASNIQSGTISSGVKITTGNVTASGTASASTFLRGDGSWNAPSGSGDMTKAVYDPNDDGIVSTAAYCTSSVDIACRVSTGTFVAQIASIGTSTATLRTDLSALRVSTGAFATVGASTATLRTDITTLWTATGTLKTTLTSVALSTAALRTDMATVGVSTASLKARIDNLETWTVSVSSPYALIGSTICVSRYFPYAVTITTVTARCTTGTSAVYLLTHASKSATATLNACLPTTTAVATANIWTGNTFSDSTIPANTAIFCYISAVTGSVQNLIIDFAYTKD